MNTRKASIPDLILEGSKTRQKRKAEHKIRNIVFAVSSIFIVFAHGTSLQNLYETFSELPTPSGSSYTYLDSWDLESHLYKPELSVREDNFFELGFTSSDKQQHDSKDFEKPASFTTESNHTFDPLELPKDAGMMLSALLDDDSDSDEAPIGEESTCASIGEAPNPNPDADPQAAMLSIPVIQFVGAANEVKPLPKHGNKSQKNVVLMSNLSIDNN